MTARFLVGFLVLLLAGCSRGEDQLSRLQAEEASALSALRTAQQTADEFHARCVNGEQAACVRRDSAAYTIPDAQIELDLARLKLEIFRDSPGQRAGQ
jgi:hypothetical protein